MKPNLSTLSSGWEVARLDDKPEYHQPQIQRLEWIPAEVPGHVHLDLLRAGIIADPFSRCHEAGLSWIDNARWAYRTHIEWRRNDQLQRQVLRFEGLDTVATIHLNGSRIGSSDNMFSAVEIDVTGALVDGQNELIVEFDSSVKVGTERRRAYFEKEGLPWTIYWFDERAFVRKAGYMYGWDWGPRLVSCGIWKPVQLLEYNERILRASFLQERLEDGRYRVWVEAEVEGEGKLGAQFANQVRQPGERLEFLVEEPRLWWPNGDGEPYLYEARVFLESGHELRKKIGLRTIRLLRENDDFGQSFCFEVNGRKIWSRGANWIPNDSFLGRSTDGEIHEQIERCKGLSMNMLRVWGGGVYESEAFYDACDKQGILVWQDFPYACSYYPDGPEEQELAREEAAEQISRLRDRASLALWCGNNENLAMWEGAWGGLENRVPRYYGDNIYSKALPEILHELDPIRPYIPTSPVLPSEEELSDSHYWDVWHGRGDWNFYRDSKTRFSSEFGFASSCSMKSWSTVLEAADYAPRSIPVRWHDKTNKGADTFEGYVLAHYPQWESLEDWVYLSQLNQRDALRFGIEHYRRSEFCKGSLIWQFNDCWPVQSWAVQDYSRLVKPAGHELARLYAPALLSIDVYEGNVTIYAINDSPDALRTFASVRAVSTLDGKVVKEWAEGVEIESGSRKPILILPLADFIPHQTAILVEMESDPMSRNWRFLDEPKAMTFGGAKLSAVVGDKVTINVEGFVGDLVVWDPDDEANLFDLRDGQPGWRAFTAANESIELGCQRVPRRLAGRSLAEGGRQFAVPIVDRL